MKDDKLNQLFCKFMGAFEIVFHYDWNYTKIMIGDERENHTFLKPDIDDENEDWGARGQLLELYRELKSEMNRQGIKSEISTIWKEHIKDQPKI